MIINLTTPITVDHHHVAEFEAAVEVTITHRGTGPSFDHPGDAPEWDVDGYFVDVGFFHNMHNGKHVWRPNLLPCPDNLSSFINDYLDTTEGRDNVTCALQERGDAA